MGAPGPDHAPTTAATDQQTPQQIAMLRVVALRPLPIAHQWDLRVLPRLGIDERRYPDGDPFGLRASRAALAIAGVALFEPPRVPYGRRTSPGCVRL